MLYTLLCTNSIWFFMATHLEIVRIDINLWVVSLVKANRILGFYISCFGNYGKGAQGTALFVLMYSSSDLPCSLVNKKFALPC